MRFSSALITCGLICCFVCHAAAQTADMKVPGLGFARDGRSKQLHLIRGIPGSAVLGGPIGITDHSTPGYSTPGHSSAGFSSAVISPRQDLALAVAAGDGRVRALRLPSGAAQDIPGVANAPSRILFSPSGTAALLWSSKLQLLSGLPDSITVQDLATPANSGPLSPLAISDSAQFVLASTGSGDAAATWLLAPGAAPIPLTFPGPLAVAAFRPASPDAVAAGADGTVYRILNSNLPGEDRTAGAVALRVSVDGTRVYTANQLGTLTAIRFDLPVALLDAVNCGCTPAGMEPLTSAGLFRINDIADRPVMLFDVSTPPSRVWFVPADAPASNSPRSAQ